MEDNILPDPDEDDIINFVHTNPNRRTVNVLFNDESSGEESRDAYTLKPVRKKSDSEVWQYFGYLHKNCTPVPKVESRMFCRLCFDENPRKFKR